MAGGLINIIAGGANDLFLTGTPQITFFNIIYRRYTNFAVESIYYAIEDINFDTLSHVELPKIGDLIGKTYLQIEIPSVNFAKSLLNIEPSVGTISTYETEYNYIVNFMELNIGTYKNGYDSYIAENITAEVMIDNMIDYFTSYPGFGDLTTAYDDTLNAYYNVTENPLFSISLSNIYQIITHI